MSGITAALSMVHGVAEAEPDEFRVGHVGEDATQHQVPLADAPAVRFEVMTPTRRFAARNGQRHLMGLWWSSTVAGHVQYESWLERDHPQFHSDLPYTSPRTLPSSPRSLSDMSEPPPMWTSW
jgi:hypothetical protein